MERKQLLFFIFGAVFAILGIVLFFINRRNNQKAYVSISGTVIDFKTISGENGYSFAPIFEYYYGGKTYQVVHRISSSKTKNGKTVPGSKYKIGDTVPLRVYEDKPEKALEESKGNLNLLRYMGLGFLAFGMLFLGLAIWGFPLILS